MQLPKNRANFLFSSFYYSEEKVEEKKEPVIPSAKSKKSKK